MEKEQIDELLYQALETELGGVQVYAAAVECAVNEDAREEWTKYGEETKHHVEIVEGIFKQLGLDPSVETPGRLVVRHLGEALVEAMHKAKEGGRPEAAELVAAECICMAEFKDHQNWELMGHLLKERGFDAAYKEAIKPAHEEVEGQEDQHLYHTMGWSRELWIQSLGMSAVLPPPEEVKKVETAIGAARAQQQRGKMKKAS